MKRYVDGAKLGTSGACHILRHTMATLMLEGDARRCHPGARVVEAKKEPEVEEAKEKLFEQLDDEDDDDAE